MNELVKFYDENIKIGEDIKCPFCEENNFKYLYSSNGYIKQIPKNNYHMTSIKIKTPNTIFCRCKNCNQEFYYIEEENE